MANNTLNYTIKVNSDLSGIKQLQSSVKDLQASLQKKQSGKLIDSKEFEKASKAAEDLSKILDKSWNNDLNQLNLGTFDREVKKSYGSLKEMRKQFDAMGPEGSAAFQKLMISAGNSHAPLKKTNKLLQEMADSMSKTIKWGISSSIFNSLTGSLQKAWNYSKNLDSALNDIRIVTGESADQMERFAHQATKVAKGLGQSTLDYTKASLIYYQQGLSDAEVAAKTQTTLKAANITGQSAQAVSEQLTAVWNGYKVDAAEAELYVDKLQAVAATTASDLQELSTGMSKVASAANLMGVGMDSLNAQLATIISVTKQAPESVGTALKTIYARMGDIEAGLDTETTLGEYTSKMAEMGVNVLDANGKLRDMGDVIEEIGGNWKNMTREQQLSLSQTMAGTRQYNNLLSLFDNWDMYTRALQTSESAAGSLQKAQDTYMESTEAHLQKLSTEAERTYNVLFDTDTVNGFADALTGVLSVFNNFIEGIGGGGHALTLFGSIAANLFSEQLSQGVVGSINKAKEKIKELNPENRGKYARQTVESLNQSSGASVDEETREKQVEFQEKILAVQKGLTEEQVKKSQELNTRYGIISAEIKQLQDEVDLSKEEKEILEKIGLAEEKNLDVLGKRIGMKEKELDASKEQLTLLKEISSQQGKMTSKQAKSFIQDNKKQIRNNIFHEKYSTEDGKIDINKLYDEGFFSNKKRKELNRIKDSEEQADAAFKIFLESLEKSLQSSEEETSQGVSATVQDFLNGLIKEAEEEIEEGEQIVSGGKKKLKEEENRGKIKDLEEEQGKIEGDIGKIAEEGDLGAKIEGIIEKGSIALGILTSVHGAVKTFTDDTATVEDKAHAIGGALSGVAASVGSFFSPLGTTIGSMVGMGIEAIASTDWFVDLFKSAKEKAQEFKAEMEAIAQEHSAMLGAIQEESQNLYSSIENYETARTALKELTIGTDEWKDSVADVNTEVLKLMQLYPQLASFIKRDENGVLVLDTQSEDFQNFINEQQEQQKAGERATIAGNMVVNESDKGIVYNDTDRFTYTGTYKETTSGGFGATAWEKKKEDVYSDNLSSKVVEEIITKINTEGESFLFDKKSLKIVTGYDDRTIEGIIKLKDELITAAKEVKEVDDVNQTNREEYIRSKLSTNTAYQNSDMQEGFLIMTENAMKREEGAAQEKWEKEDADTVRDEYQKSVGASEHRLTEDNKVEYKIGEEWIEMGDDAARTFLVMEEAANNAMAGVEETLTKTESLANGNQEVGNALLSFVQGESGKIGNLKSTDLNQLQALASKLANPYNANNPELLDLAEQLGYTRDKTGLEELSNSIVTAINNETEHRNEENLKSLKIALRDTGQDAEALLKDSGVDFNDYEGVSAEEILGNIDFSQMPENEEEVAKWFAGAVEKGAEKAQIDKKFSDTAGISSIAKALDVEEDVVKQAKERLKARLSEEQLVEMTNEELNEMVERELRISKGVKNLSKEWDEIKKQIKSTDLETISQGFASVKKHLQEISGLTDEEINLFSQEEIESFVPLIEEAMAGNEESFATLMRNLLNKSIPKDIKIYPEIEVAGITTAEAEIQNFADAMDAIINSTDATFEIDGDNSALIASLNESLRYVDANTTDVQKMLKKYGFDAQVVLRTEYSDVPMTPGQKPNQYKLQNGEPAYPFTVPSVKVITKDDGSFGGGSSLIKDTSGGGGGSTKAPDERNKFDGQIDKYNEINGVLTRINNSLEEQDKLLNKVTGKDKIKGYDKQLSLLNKQNKALKEKKELLKDEAKDLKTDLTKKENLTHSGKEYKFNFDKNGNITNYNDVLTSIENDINEKIKIRNQKLEGFDSLSDEDKKKRQEEIDALDKEIDDYETFFDRVKGWADRYGTIINDEIPGVVSEISNNLDKEIEAKLAKLELKVQLKVDFRNAKKSLVEFQKSNISEYNLKGLSGKNDDILDAYTMVVSKNKNGKYTTTPGLIDTAMTSFDRAYDAWKNIKAGETDKDYGLDSAKAFEAMQASAEEMVSYIGEAQGVIEETWGYYEQGIENANTALTEHIGQYDKLTSKVQYFLDLQELQRDSMTDREYWTAQKDAYTQMQAANTNKKSELKNNLTFWETQKEELMKTLFTEKELENIVGSEWGKASSEKRVEAFKAAYQEKIKNEKDTEKRALLQKDYDDLLNSEAWQGVNDNIEETQNNIQETTKNTLENINKIYEATKELARLNLSDSIFGENFNLEKEQEKWEIFLDWQDKYLDSVTKNFKINDFVQKINDALENTDSLAIQERLNKLKEDELELLNQKGKVTQQDLDRMNKMLDVELKRIALEEAQKNKSTMRLRRDASGNYSYQYVADQEDIDKKQQELTKAEADWHADTLENFGGYLDNLFTLFHQTENLIMNGEDPTEVLNQAMPSFKDLAATIQQLETDLKNQGMTDDEIKSDPRYDAAMQLINKITSNALITKEDGTTETVSAIKALFSDLGKKIAGAEAARDKAFGDATDPSEETLPKIENTTKNLLEEGKTIRNQQTNILNTLKTNFENIKDSLDTYLLAAQGILKDFRDIAKQNASGGTGAVSQRVVDAGGDKNAKTNEVNVPTSSLSFQSLPENFDINNPLKSISAKDVQRLAPYVYEIDTEVKKAWIEDKKGIGDWVELEKSIKKGTKVLLLKSNFTDKGGEPAVTVEYIQDGKAISNIIKAKTLKGFDTGGYTGSWSGNKDGLDSKGGRLALLHQKELILNPKDTENFLAALKELKQIKMQEKANIALEDKPLDIETILKNIDKSLNNAKEKINTKYQLEISLNTKEFADKLDALVQDKANLLSMTSSEFEKAFKNVITDTKTQSFKQSVQINAEFPGVNNSLEIERAFNSLTSKAQRYMVDETAI